MLFKRRHRHRRRIRKLRLLALTFVLFVLAGTAFSYGLVVAIGEQLEGLDPFAKANRQQVDGYVYAADGRTILAVLRGSQSRVLVPSEQISPWVKQAIVAVEDRRFYEHRGIDLRGMGRALWADVRHKAAVQGGSTITQQFVKNELVGTEKSVTRKLKEATLAWQLEQKWNKDRILTAYLNTIYFANGAYGIERAARTYFGHNAKKLTLAESALLAGIPEDPSRWDPVARPKQARRRRAIVLRAMLDQDIITRTQYRVASRAPMPRPQDVRLPGVVGRAPYFGEYVKRQLIGRLGAKRVFGGGFRVSTTVNMSLQRAAREAIDKWLPSPDGPQAALVAINPVNGAVVAMYGGRNFHASQFNLAVQGERQPGSSFKPFVLATALKQGIAPQTTFVSKPVSIFLGDKYWPVDNYEGEYLGTIDLWKAISASDNSVFAQLTKLVGPAAVVQTAKSLGIGGALEPVFSIGLGTQIVSPLDMARAYAAFANGGYRIDGKVFGNQPRAITRIDGPDGTPLFENAPVRRQVLTATQSALLTQMLTGVVTGGTGKGAAMPGWTVAGKTGTTENYGDAWFVGYTPQLVTAVWVGYPDKLRPMLKEYRGGPVAGGTYPALIWKSFMQAALKDVGAEPRPFPAPPPLAVDGRRITYRDGRVELDNGQCRDSSYVVYFTGTGPTTTATCRPNEVDVPNVVGLRLDRARVRLQAQPLTARLIYRPAVVGEKIGVVVKQYPSTGTLSSYGKVTLVLAKPVYGTVPKLVGLELAKAKQALQQRKLRVAVAFAPGRTGRVLSQQPAGGVAAAAGMTVKITVGAAGSGSASR